MFHEIPQTVRERMKYLEDLDAGDRKDGTPREKRLRQIPPEMGKFIAILAGGAPEGAMIEIGASAGYSALWLALACGNLGRKLVTFEVCDEKVKLARETFQSAGVQDVVDLVEGDARRRLDSIEDIAFCFLDAEKDIYLDCYEALIPRMVRGAIMVADNAVSHGHLLRDFLDRALGDRRVDALIVPIGNGALLCRKV
ncbi:MAG: class I SAM-dependent methyltransferase [Syntrophobacteraceae bacterium]